jgi:MFS family permease
MPLLWLFSANHYYLLCVQVMSGFVWSGFSLSTANYLYDIRPHKSDFAVYAAMQSALGAVAVFIGAIMGGLIASAAPGIVASVSFLQEIRSPLFLVFFTSFVLRMAIAIWFIPRAVEPRVRRRPKILQIIYRVSRFNAISGVSLDWLSVTKRRSEEAAPDSEPDSEEPGEEKQP